MDSTPNLGLPYILPAQAQKHVTHNEAIRALDALVQLTALSRTTETPPATPAEGDRYIIPAGASGAWSGHVGAVAAFQDAAWAYYGPTAGWTAWIIDEAVAVVFEAGVWVELVPAPTGAATWGINATADLGNRLAVASPATLFDHEGAGHQLKINKASSGDTASILLQTAFSGRAEIGTVGGDDLRFKVSADGVSFLDAIVVDHATGAVAFPHSSFGTAGGADRQVQWNNAGALAGMGGSTWTSAKQQLRLDGTDWSPGYGTSDTATLVVAKTRGAACLDLETDYSGKVLRILGPSDVAAKTPVTYVGNGGELKTRAWLTVSGSTSGTGDGYVINDPLDAGTYPQMLSVWSDVGFALTVRTFNADNGYGLVALDRSGHFRFMMPEDGRLTWGPATASTPAGIDTGLSRIGAGTLAVGNGAAGDISGTLKLTQLQFADGSTQATAGTVSPATSTVLGGIKVGAGLAVAGDGTLSGGIGRYTLTQPASGATLAIADGKTFAVNASLTLAGSDGTTHTLPGASGSLAGLAVAQTWTAAQTFNAGLSMPASQIIAIGNQGALTLASTSGVPYNALQIDSGNAFIIGSGTMPGNAVWFAPSGKEIRFLDHVGNRIVSLQESTAKIVLGSSSSFDGTTTIMDGVASTGDTTVCIRDGAARAARVRLGSNGGTYDVGFGRESSGLIAIHDGSTTLTNYRDLKVRALYSGAAQVVGARKTGWGAPTGTATRTTFDTASVTLSALAERVRALIDDLTSHGLIGA